MPKVSSITFNEFTVKDSFAFAEEFVPQYGKLFMVSLDIDSLLTHIPLKETINICTNLLYNNIDVIEGINKSDFENLLSMATQDLYFMFNDILYKQIDGVVKGRPLGPTMANVFFSFYEAKGYSALTNSNQLFTEDMLMIFLFYLNQLNSSQNVMHILLHVILICLFHLNKK